MSRLFITNKDVNFFNVIGKELIQDVVGQQITYYAVSSELTKTDDLYGEALKKTVYHPVEINALVLYNNPSQNIDQFSMDTVYTIEVYFLIDELTERGIEPKVGDFVQFGSQFYEVQQLTKPDLVYGQVENKVQARAICGVARAGQFKLPPMEPNI